jgi:hypothetical protein
LCSSKFFTLNFIFIFLVYKINIKKLKKKKNKTEEKNKNTAATIFLLKYFKSKSINILFNINKLLIKRYGPQVSKTPLSNKTKIL